MSAATRAAPSGIAPDDRRPGVAGLNPVAKIAAALVLALALAFSIDVVSAGVALALELSALPLVGLGWRRFWRRTAAVWIAAPLAGVAVLLYGRPSGQIYLTWLFVQVSAGSLQLAVATVLRVLAIALPAVALFATVDATELADGLAQRLRLPARFVLGALAAVRLVGLLREDWQLLELARRARGVADRARVRRLASAAFALFVLAIRRGSALATAMEARGFGGSTPRSWARPSPFGAGEVLLVLVAAAIAALAVATAMISGQWVLIGH